MGGSVGGVGDAGGGGGRGGGGWGGLITTGIQRRSDGVDLCS